MQITQTDIDRAEVAVARAEAQLANHQGPKFFREYYDLKNYAKEARSDLEALKAQRESEFVAATAERSVVETANAEYLKTSQTELDADQKSLREAAIKAQTALVEFLDARQTLEDNFTRINGALTVRGLKLDGDYRNGAERNCVRLAGTDYIRVKDAESHLAWVTGRVANARIRRGGLIGGLMSRFTGVRMILIDVDYPKAAKFPAMARLVAPPREDTTPSNMTDQERKAALERRKPTKGRLFNPSDYFGSDPDLTRNAK